MEQWIEQREVDLITLETLYTDLMHNRPISEGHYKFVKGLIKKQNEMLQHVKVSQVAKLRTEEMVQITFSHQQEVQKLLRQHIDIQRKQKEFAIRQCEVKSQQAKIHKRELYDRKLQILQIRERNLVLQQRQETTKTRFQALKEQNIKLKNQKETSKILYQQVLQEIKKTENENQLLKKESLDLRQIQKRNCQEIQELQKRLKDCQCDKQQHNKLLELPRKIKISADKQLRCLKQNRWVIDNTNSNVCIKMTDFTKNNPNYWMCSSPLPFDGEFMFTIKVIKLKEFIRIGVMENQKKGEERKYTQNYSVYLFPNLQTIYRPNQQQTSRQLIEGSCSKYLPQCPFQIEIHVHRQQNTIAWHYDGKQQIKSILPKAWKINRNLVTKVILWK